MTDYDPQKIEKKWQRFWEREKIFKAKDFSKKPKLYLLVEFPYPSGEGLHVGHCRSYVGLDVIARKKRMEGFNVLFPMGWDAFGLPTENYAIKTGISPQVATKKNTSNFKRQQKSLGLSFDWSREINTTDPSYYKWTQWIFLQFFKEGLAYKAKIPINWCPKCKIGLANEEVIEGKCERCGSSVVRKEKEQWMLKITEYADRLIKDLELVDYPEKVKALQRDWIGRSEGVEVKFQISNSKFQIKVFTTRIDTIFGVTYLVLAPEHPIIEDLKSQILNFKSVENYIKKAKMKLERERIAKTEEKTGIKLEGVEAVNPANGKEIPVFVADYVLPHYGTGAIMGVPAHDQRDLEFAHRFNLPVVEVIEPKEKKEKENGFYFSNGRYLKAFEGEGILINSGRFDGLDSKKARERIFQFLAKKGLAQKAVHYKLRDWVFSRQRYWGEPIPLVFCENCKKKIQSGETKGFNKGELMNPGWISVAEKDLPVKLPKVKDFYPTEKGESPLAKVENWVKTYCPKCGAPARRETDVMPNWAGSNWYYLRYCDPQNEKRLAHPKLLRYWMPVDWYNGGMEHTTLHLLYSRFCYKFLWDIGAVPKELGPEPYKKRTSHGIILAEGGVKMSKSKGNVINPDDIVKKYGADTLRCYEMFMGPFNQPISWDTKGVRGMRRFLERIWNLFERFQFKKEKQQKHSELNSSILSLKKFLHKTIKKVSEDIDNMKFNTALSSLMEFSNAWGKEKVSLGQKEAEDFLKLLSPFAPHLAEELFQKLQKKKNLKKKQRSIFETAWPKYDLSLIEEEKIIFLVQVNGKLRDKIELKKGSSESEVKNAVEKLPRVKKWIAGKKIKKVIFLPDKLINFVV